MVTLLSLAIMTLDHRVDRSHPLRAHLDTVRWALSSVVYPLQYAVDLPIRAGRWVSEVAASHGTLLSENHKLREQHLLIQSRLEKFAELEAENRRLRELLDSSAKVGERVLIAEMLSVSMDPFSRQIVLNKGTRDGIVTGQSLIDANGVMGQVVHAGPFSSTALLITDPNHALPTQVNRSGLRFIAVGRGAPDQLELAHVANNADVEIGDLLVTSGLGGRFPAGYPVGRVVSVERDNGQPFARVQVRPSARLERNREVLIVWPPEDPALAGPLDSETGHATQ